MWFKKKINIGFHERNKTWLKLKQKLKTQITTAVLFSTGRFVDCTQFLFRVPFITDDSNGGGSKASLPSSIPAGIERPPLPLPEFRSRRPLPFHNFTLPPLPPPSPPPFKLSKYRAVDALWRTPDLTEPKRSQKFAEIRRDSPVKSNPVGPEAMSPLSTRLEIINTSKQNRTHRSEPTRFKPFISDDLSPLQFDPFVIQFDLQTAASICASNKFLE